MAIYQSDFEAPSKFQCDNAQFMLDYTVFFLKLLGYMDVDYHISCRILEIPDI